MRRPHPRVPLSVLVAVLAVVGLLALPTSDVRGAPYPPLPIPLDRQFLGNLSVPSVAPGASASLHYSFANPSALGGSISSVVLTFEVYAFNGFPSDGSASLPVSTAPVLSNATASGPLVTVAIAGLTSGAGVAGSIGVATSSDTPTGTFAIRTSVAFQYHAVDYRLESRGWFSAATWNAATVAANGSATLNLTTLGVSGVIPETAVFVHTSDWAWALGALLAGAFVLLAAGAWVYWRRGPGSSSGAG